MMAMLYGGSGSGKSELAETMLSSLEHSATALVYIATMLPGSGETSHRIARHQAARAHKGFITLEQYTDLGSATIPPGSAVLLECLGNLVANELFSPKGAGASARHAVVHGLETLSRKANHLVIVSNDVFADGTHYSPEVEEYRGILAELNEIVASRSSLVAEVVCGIPLWLKCEGVWK